MTKLMSIVSCSEIGREFAEEVSRRKRMRNKPDDEMSTVFNNIFNSPRRRKFNSEEADTEEYHY